MLRQPFWVRSLAVGAPFGLVMFAVLRWFEEGWLGVVTCLGMGLLYGFVTTHLMDRQGRRTLHAGGESLTADQLVEVVGAVDAGRWPPDPGLHEPVERLARHRLRPSESPWAVAAVFSACMGYAVVRAAPHDPLWWIIAGFVAAVAVWAVTRTRRQRRAARCLLVRPAGEDRTSQQDHLLGG